MLEVTDIHAGYGRSPVLHGVSVAVFAGQVTTLIGANGVGKSTSLRTISGLLAPKTGRILLDSERIDGRRPHEIVERGIAHVPEGRRIFADLTIEENLRLGAYRRRNSNEFDRQLEQVFNRFPILGERRRQLGGTLSGGEQQMLAIARALMSRPRLLLLDEPSLGLAPRYVERVFGIIRDLSAEGIGILLVEQNAHMALTIAHKGYVMEGGRVVLSGTGAELLRSDAVREAYLGM